jgi:asparagine synthase (glutamine-hydrolysing)
VPVAWWLNRGLRGETDRLLSDSALRKSPFLDAAYVGNLLAEHRSGRGNHARPLWAIVMLQYWLENWSVR